MKHDINKNKYGYLGQYKSPLIYHWLLQQWVDGKATKKYNLPKLDGRLLLLDGHMFFYQKDWDILIELTRKAVREKEHQFFTSVFKNTEDKINEVLYLSEKLNKTNKLNTALLKKLFSTVHDMEFPWIVMIPMGEELEIIIREKLKEFNLPEKELQLFFSLKKDTLLIKQKKELLNIKKKIEKAGILDRVKKITTKKAMNIIKQESPALCKEIQDHIKRFQWFGMMHFWGSSFNEEKFIAQVETTDKLVKQEAHITKLNKEFTWIKKRTLELAYWRNHVAEVCAIASHAVVNQFRLAAEKLSIDYKQIRWLSPKDFFKALDGKPIPSPKILKEREHAFGLIVENNKIIIIVGKELERLINLLLGKIKKINGIKGLSANKGKIKGNVKIILSPEEISKVKKGDILIAPETTPDFIPVIHLVKAIVTDMGGITSHAAIVSREFNIPCIVGTKNATKVLKDDDLVEVDANNGIVKILKSK